MRTRSLRICTALLFICFLKVASGQTTICLHRLTLPHGQAPPFKRASSRSPFLLIMFSDCECPCCRLAVPFIERLVAKSSHKVQVTFRNYPLSFHSMRAQAPIMASCAGTQDENAFWRTHDFLLSAPEAIMAEIASDQHFSLGSQ